MIFTVDRKIHFYIIEGVRTLNETMSLSNIAEQLSYLHLNTLEVKHYEIQSRQSIFSVYEFSGGIYRTERDLSDYMSADFYHRPGSDGTLYGNLERSTQRRRIHFSPPTSKHSKKISASLLRRF